MQNEDIVSFRGYLLDEGTLTFTTNSPHTHTHIGQTKPPIKTKQKR